MQVTIEGIACNFEQFAPVKSSTNSDKSKDISKFGKGATDIPDILRVIRENKKEDWKNVSSSMTIVEKHGDLFLDYADSVKVPDWFDAEKEDIGQVVKLMEWFRDMAAVVYVQADFVNDFYLLHGVTGKLTFQKFVNVLSLLELCTVVASIFHR